MKTAINFNALKGMDTQTQLAALAGAVAFEFSKVKHCIAMNETAAIHASSSVKNPLAAANAPSFDSIKSYLARKYSTPDGADNLTDVANQYEQFFHTNMTELDLGYMVLFDEVDLRDSTHDHFDILDTAAGLTWEQRKPGQRVKIKQIPDADKITVNYTEYAEGVGLQDQWLQFNQFWHVDAVIAEFRSTYYEKMALQHYGLLTALSSAVDQAFATDDVTTCNNAMGAILRAVRAKGYGASENSGFQIVCAVEHVGRIEKMLTAQRGSAMVDQGTVSQPLKVRIANVIGTTHIPANSTGYYLVLPGNKLQRGTWMDLTVEQARDIYASAEDLVGRGQYNAAIGDSDQIKRCLFA